MIRINKGTVIPTILTTKGHAKTNTHCSDYDSDPIAYQTGTKKLDIDEKVYGHKEVKNKLVAIQYEKCCFCEGKFKKFAHGDVEHFRPKGGYQQDEGETLQKPGYYWLAYDWDNLFFSCQICNQQYKKNFFPLTDPNARAKSHHNSIGAEDPVMVHPSDDDPEIHVSFRKEIIYGKTEKGKMTIKRTGLDRLDEERLESLKIVRTILYLLELEPDNLEAKEFVEKWKLDSAEFRGMIKANFPELA